MGNKLVEGLSAINTKSLQVTPDILIMNFTIVNAFLVGTAENYILVDTGLENSAKFILQCIEDKFGKNSKPKSIVLTHGHFDHVGSVKKLSELWNIPVYIHQLEMPYVTGKKDYPVGDSTVDKGIVAKLSPTFPHTSIDITTYVKALPSDGSVPEMPEWKWIHTPGHTDGHISLFREKDGALIVGDAFSTTKQESILSVLSHKEQISGPPKYLTTNWKAAKSSVKLLRDLKPSLAIPSHGEPMNGQELTKHLDILVNNFDEIAVPEQGVFVTK
ncbi:MBL fold metallo-hydrolase [Clostridium neuense]|uniref:MBL fold metallo-hydrolase n=1 Tax=Clostridium neuense TaxID=1728934 RepID=A0ABW8TMF6_9CLOT